MSVAQTRGARRKLIARFGRAHKARTVADAMADERRRAAKQLAAASKKK